MSNAGQASHHQRVAKFIQSAAEELTRGDRTPSDEAQLEEAIAIADKFDYSEEIVLEKLAKTVERITTAKRKAGVYG